MVQTLGGGSTLSIIFILGAVPSCFFSGKKESKLMIINGTNTIFFATRDFSVR
jgi:hypothetical protein